MSSLGSSLLNRKKKQSNQTDNLAEKMSEEVQLDMFQPQE
jgi:hypothetical protein